MTARKTFSVHPQRAGLVDSKIVQNEFSVEFFAVVAGPHGTEGHGAEAGRAGRHRGA